LKVFPKFKVRDLESKRTLHWIQLVSASSGFANALRSVGQTGSKREAERADVGLSTTRAASSQPMSPEWDTPLAVNLQCLTVTGDRLWRSIVLKPFGGSLIGSGSELGTPGVASVGKFLKSFDLSHSRIVGGSLRVSAHGSGHAGAYKHLPIPRSLPPLEGFLMSSPSLPALQRLHRLDRSSSDFQDQLSNALYGEEHKRCVSNLQGDDLVWLVDYLDKVR